jgi:ubiquinone/menaquinone biosynthesis C-methylase UbiE
MLLRTGLRTVNVVQGDVRNLPFTDQTFDRALFYSVVGHLDRKELRRALEELWRVVRPGGTVLIGDVMDPKRALIWSAQRKLGLRRGLTVRMNAWLARRLGRATWWYPQKEFQGMVAKIGFTTQLVAQDGRIPHSRYRYDCLAVRPTSPEVHGLQPDGRL